MPTPTRYTCSGDYPLTSHAEIEFGQGGHGQCPLCELHSALADAKPILKAVRKLLVECPACVGQAGPRVCEVCDSSRYTLKSVAADWLLKNE
jgi:hypothetical protein